jgi:hypothetical protein
MSAVVLTNQVVALGRGQLARLPAVQRAHQIDDRSARHRQLMSGRGELGGEESQVEPPQIEPGRVAAPQRPEGRPGDRAEAGRIDDGGADDVAAGGMDRRESTSWKRGPASPEAKWSSTTSTMPSARWAMLAVSGLRTKNGVP